MPDLDDLDHDNEETNTSPSERMESPGDNNRKITQFIFVGAVIAVIAVILFTGDDDGPKSVDNITEESIETVDESQSRSTRGGLRIPDDEPPTLKEQIKEKQESKVVYIERPAQQPKPETKDNSRFDELMLLDRKRREEEAKRAAEREEMMRQRMMAGMDGRRNGSRSSSNGSYTDVRRDELERRRAEAEAMRDQVMASGGLQGGSSRLTRGQQPSYDTQLLSMPTSQTNTVHAENLQDVDFLITEGTIIQASLESAINSNLPGKIRAIVNAPVYSYSGNAKLIAPTSELIGEYRSASDGGEPRVFVIWTRLITSDGISIRLDSGGIDPIGRSGVSGWVDTHFMKRFGASVLLSVIGGYTQAEADSTNQAQAVSDSFNRSAEIALESSINIKPTVKLNQGQRVAIFVNQDLNFKSAMSTRRIDRLSPPRQPDHQIAYDRVFDESPLTYEERAMLANRFIADKKRINAASHIQRPFVGEMGQSLHAVIKEWARRGNHTLYWQVEDAEGNMLDWTLATDISIHGTLHDVVARVLNAYRKAGVNLSHQFFKENNVLVIRMAE